MGSKMRNLVLICVALLVISLAVYMRVGDYGFLNYDDDAYVTDNPHVASGITGTSIAWAFTSVDAANWHPVTWLSHMADVELYGMNPRGHHLTNVIIHAISTLLVLLLLLRSTGALWPSAFVAVLFALHPLHVESVAWVAERKDVLSAFFWFLTLLIYGEFAAKRKLGLYFLALFTFILGLMSKPMLVTLPVVMLLLDFWPLNRLHREGEPGLRLLSGRVLALVKEKIPFFICSFLSAAVTIYAQSKGGAVKGLTEVPFQLRIENVPIAYVTYIGKIFWPHNLAMLYPLPQSIPLWHVISSLFFLLLVSGVTIRAARTYPYLAVGWFWFLVTLVPVIGLVQVGLQAMADRYMYIPLTGIGIMVAWGVRESTKSLPHREGVLALLAATVIIASAAVTFHQIGFWRDSITLYRHTLQVTTDNYIIHDNLGLSLERAGNLDAAIREYEEALRINPFYQRSLANLGLALARKGNLDAAIGKYQEALQINPNYNVVHNNLGLALARKGNLDAAIGEYHEALRINPDYVEAHNNLGVALARKGDLDAAIGEFREALRTSPDNMEAYKNLERALTLTGRRIPGPQ
ncbi:tetratricopeptide repeat protein [Geobacter sp. AOG2]|uniref:tetratricopeptide repeat protein n=1 Tax=Geobacter sp. AOG2 TaxID=1566347 RepID=UPI001CC3DCA0|nr:tetratricopeptide repeat protein [Geobacter sp. AOG2]GFE62149.1 O-GlcNAc transferase [Geobacter sp. AOG2]